MATITYDGCYTVKFDFNRGLIEDIKNRIPYAGRKWDQAEKCWKVDAKHANILRQIFPDDEVPTPAAVSQQAQKRSIDLRYVGQVKDRGDGDHSAFGFSVGAWCVVFPEAVLREWFEGTEEHPKIDTSTLYGVIGVSKDATADEIKAGYRRMAKQWHPDVCREPNANEVFLKIREAFDILSNPDKKVRYDVGLRFESRLERKKKKDDFDGYRSPLRCGNVAVEGVDVLGRFVVSKILSWDDVVDDYGRTLVTSWVMGDDKPIESWV